MRSKIPELVQNALSLENVLDAVSKSDHFGVNRSDALKLLRDYSALMLGDTGE